MKAGDLVLVKFPFTNLKSEKKRPGLVLNTVHFAKSMDLVTIAMVTSKLDGLLLKGDVQLGDYKEAHLLHPSIVRLAKIATIDSELIESRLGKLSVSDEKLVKRAFHSLFENWI